VSAEAFEDKLRWNNFIPGVFNGFLKDEIGSAFLKERFSLGYYVL